MNVNIANNETTAPGKLTDAAQPVGAPNGAKLDLIIEGGWVVDGSGEQRYRADVGVLDGRIAAIGELHQHTAVRRIDARNKLVAPGFIDVHGHDDLMFIQKPGLPWKTSQGVTTVVVGNCGVSASPAPLPHNTAASLALLGDIPLYADMERYLATLESLQPQINVAALVGHANLRLAIMQDPAAEPAPQELQAMQALLRQSLAAGAVGFSTGLAYEPGCYASQAELEALARVAKEFEALHTSHIRNEGNEVEQAVEEVLSVSRNSGCAMVISHHKCMMNANWGKSERTIANIDAARAQGSQVAMDIYPYSGSSTILIPERAYLIERIKITWSTPHPECNGMYLADIAVQWDCDKEEAARRLLPAGAIYFAMDEQEVQRIFQHPCCMVGSDGLPNDSNPHPRLWGTFTRILGRYVREDRLLSVEQAVRKITSLPASVYGLVERGQIRPGYWADLVVFDPDTIIDRATWDEPTLPSEGIEMVAVNGQIVFPPPGPAQTPSTRPGQVLRRQPPA